METEKEEAGRVVKVANKRKMSGTEVVLRFLALALSLAAAVIVGVNKSTVVTSVPIAPTLPPLTVTVTAKWHYLSAFVFFVVANAIACGHAGVSLILTLASRGKSKGTALMVVLSDLVIVALLFSSIGAALAIGLMGYKGNTHVQWNKVCHVFDKFCDRTAAAIGLSGGAALLFFFLLVIATVNLHKKH